MAWREPCFMVPPAACATTSPKNRCWARLEPVHVQEHATAGLPPTRTPISDESSPSCSYREAVPRLVPKRLRLQGACTAICTITTSSSRSRRIQPTAQEYRRLRLPSKGFPQNTVFLLS